MAEIFKEYLVKQTKSNMDNLAQTGIVLGAVIIAGAAFLFGGQLIGPILILGVLFGAAALFSKFNKEYEYILTNNELDIDVIFNRSKRKRVLTINMKAIEIMASIHDDRRKSELQKGNKVINASDGKNGANTYAIITSKDGTLYKILITPNEAFLNELHKQAPHKVFKKI
ncbi:DUF6106 family protein [Cellulosilyticum sp. I15G10I2]|uniref:DUF6106 family protein n=1 Tax=Cellulosilyticum sp. I15G10I2 TaxID=1892843 RepID=UPI00085C4B25|nr:DUF6106 family protein [Cellulosilyticum sp. I15G10I2]